MADAAAIEQDFPHEATVPFRGVAGSAGS
jgi:hypothetical protein